MLMKADPFAKICRLCLTTGSKLMSIFNKKKKSTKAWSESIVLLLPMLEIHQKDGLPRKICPSCISTLESYIEFRNRCIDNDQKLRQLIKQTQEAAFPGELDDVQNILEPEMVVEEGDNVNEDPNEVVVIDPKMEYYSSDDGDENRGVYMDDDDENGGDFYQYNQESNEDDFEQVEAEVELNEENESENESSGSQVNESCNQNTEETPQSTATESQIPNPEREYIQPQCKDTPVPLKTEAVDETTYHDSSENYQMTRSQAIEPPVQWELVPRDLPIPSSPRFDGLCATLTEPTQNSISQPPLIEIPQYPNDTEMIESRLLEIPQFNLQAQEENLHNMSQSTTDVTNKIVSFSIIKQLEAPNFNPDLPTSTSLQSNDLELSHLSAPVSHDDVDDRAMEEIIVQVLGDPDNHSIDFGTDPADFLDEFSDLKGDDSMSPLEVFICKFCDAAFPKQIECQIHEQDDHDPLHPYRCTVCTNGYKTDDREQFVTHMKVVHKLKKPYICFHCSKKFDKRTGLRRHTVQHAGLNSSFVCAICDRSFSRRNNLRHHLKIHTGERFGCTQCSKSFSTKHALQEHEDYHKNSDGYKCSLCGLMITRKRRLLDHERICFKKNYHNLPSELDPENVMVINLDPNMTETDDLPYLGDVGDQNDLENAYNCDVCMKGFNCKRVLKHHKQTHSSVRNYVCSYCDKAFLRRNELDRHIVSVHQQIREHQCKICEKSFSRKDKLKRHERIHAKAASHQ